LSCLLREKNDNQQPYNSDYRFVSMTKPNSKPSMWRKHHKQKKCRKIISTERKPVSFDIEKMSRDVQAYVRSQPIHFGTFIDYEENGKLINEDPRTGIKIVVKSLEKK
jgi:hypothetical protein